MFVLARRLMPPCARFLLLGALLSSPAHSRPAQDARSATPDLVVLADPSPPSDLAKGSGPVTLPYRVREIFAGEPGASSVIVTHPSLDAGERSRLAADERVILLARRDPAHAGRWTAPAPLIATPRAIAAFREWSAPTDVRPARPLADVLADARDVAIAPKGELPPDPPERTVDAGETLKAAPVEHPAEARNLLKRPAGESEEEEVAPAESWAQPRKEPSTKVMRSDEQARPCPPVVARPKSKADPSSGMPESARTPVRVAEREPSADLPRYEESVTVRPRRSPPYTFPHLLVPQPGPGLPPPPEASVLGPPLSARRDLHVPEGPPRERSSRGR